MVHQDRLVLICWLLYHMSKSKPRFLAIPPHLILEWEPSMLNSDRVGRYRFVIGGFTIWAHFAAGLNFQAISPILPLITKDYDISNTTAGLLVGVVMVIIGLLGIPAGFIAGRLGIRVTYSVSWFMMGLLTLSALSPGFEGMLALRIMFGLGMAVILPATVLLTMQWFRPKEVPIITSLNMASLSSGIMAGMATAAPLTEFMEWEKVLGLFGAIGLAGAFAWLLWGRDQEVNGTAQTRIVLGEILGVIRNRTVLLLGVADAACFSMYIALSGWLPTFYNETRDMSLTEAGFLVSLLPFMGIPAVLLGGFLTPRVSSKRLFLIIPGVLAAVGGLGSFLIDNTAVTYVSVIVLGLGAWLYVPPLLTLTMEIPGMTPERVALAWGWIMTTSGIGGFVAPLVVGILRDGYDSFIPGFLIFALLSWFLVVAGFLLPKSIKPAARVSTPAA